MRRSWLWFLLTVVGYVVGQLIGYLVSGALGYNETNVQDLTAAHRWLIVIAVAPFMLTPPAMMFVVGRAEVREGASRIPMVVAAAIFLFLFTVTIASALGLAA